MHETTQWLTDTYICHRGYHNKLVPENSITAFQKALNENFAIELDLQLTKDEKVIVFHDSNLNRMTNCNKLINECSFKEINTLKLLNTSDKIPLFNEVLELINGRVPLMIEIKQKGTIGILEEKVYKALKNYKGFFVVQSFNPYSMGWFAENTSHIIRGQLSGSYDRHHIANNKKYMLRNLMFNHISKPYFINYEIGFLQNPIVQQKREEGKLILGWTAKSLDEFIKAKKLCNNVVFENFNPL